AVPFRARVAIRLGLRTVMGLDQRPGDIPGQGPVCSSTARALAWARTRTDTAWRLQLYDDHGHLEYLLTIRPPTRGSPPADRRRRRHIVELTAHTRELDDLLAGTGIPTGLEVLDPGALTLLTRAGQALAAARARPPEQHPALSRADAHRRRPGDELARWVQARDRTCRCPGCTRQATGTDLDHTLAWDDGGQTMADDLGVLCEADHLFKHDPTTGWTVTQPHPGTFVWTAPTGRRHVITPERYDPLPEPLPPTDGSPFTLPADIYAPPPHAPEPFTPRRTRDGRITRAARNTADAMAERHRTQQGEPPSPYDHDPDF
ncbi:MAG TPA: HNH endonuclease signature motif containing protein, partial [Actinomycetospora sp.]